MQDDWAGVALALAHHACPKCWGTGLVERVPCNCVLREIFRECYRRYQQLEGGQVGQVAFSFCLGRDHKRMYERKHEDYLADFVTISRRTLDQSHWTVFRLHFIEGLDWKACSRKLRIDKASFYRAVYRLEARLGRAFFETRPYGLYPLDQYFGGYRKAA